MSCTCAPMAPLEQFAAAGYLKALDEDLIPELANLPASAQASESLRADGKVYASSFASQTFGMLVNKDIFAEVGIEVPKTWDEFLGSCDVLSEAGYFPLANGMGTAFMAEAYAITLAAGILGPDFDKKILAGETTFADEPFVNALAAVQDTAKCLPKGFGGIDQATMQQLFASGRAAMFIGGSFEIAGLTRMSPDLNMDFVAPPAPEGNAQLVSLFYDGGYAINASTDNLDDATTLLRWMTTPEYGSMMSDELANISPIAGAVIGNPLLARVAELNKNSVPYLMLVYFRYNEPTGSALIQSGVQRMMSGDATPQQVGDEITEGVATYFTPFQ